jgi:hypothetical protein
MAYKICKCGSGWDTHGMYSTCPICAKGPNDQRDATKDESEIIKRSYSAYNFESIGRGTFKP